MSHKALQCHEQDGVHKSVRLIIACVLTAAMLLQYAVNANAGPDTSTTKEWGSYLTPFAANSPWNSRPINPILGSEQIPKSTYDPAVQAGAYSTGVFLAKLSDRPMIVRPLPDRAGIWDPDAEKNQPVIVIPRWPADTAPATGTDGHADIVDPELGIIHSLFKLKKVDGVWRAQQYAWTKLKGRGWADPAHYFQGARASAVPSSAGLIRAHELDDGDVMYRHALAMSLTFNGLSPNPIYVYPATSSDTNAASVNTGKIPMGSLLMLPKDFDTRSISNKHVKKIAETLKHYGAYVVDRNFGTPFLIYVEINSGFNLHKWGRDLSAVKDLHRIRESLRPVKRVEKWVDGDNQAYEADVDEFNLISVRGQWILLEGDQEGSYDTWKQAVVFPKSSRRITMMNVTRNVFARLLWSKPVAGNRYRLTANGTGGASVRLMLTDCTDARKSVDTGQLQNLQSSTFLWPQNMCNSRLIVSSGDTEGSSIGADLRLQRQ